MLEKARTMREDNKDQEWQKREREREKSMKRQSFPIKQEENKDEKEVGGLKERTKKERDPMRQNVDVGKERARERCDEIINIKVDREVKREERETVQPRKTALKRIRTTQRDNKYRKRQENKK